MSIIKKSKLIRQYIFNQLEESKLSHAEVSRLADDNNISLTKSKLSVYFHNEEPVKGYPTEEDIIWLCKLLGIDYLTLLKEEDTNGSNMG